MAATDLRSLADLRGYTETLSAKRVEDDSAYKNWQLAKQTTWLTLLTISFLIFYLIEILHESLALLTARF